MQFFFQLSIKKLNYLYHCIKLILNYFNIKFYVLTFFFFFTGIIDEWTVSTKKNFILLNKDRSILRLKKKYNKKKIVKEIVGWLPINWEVTFLANEKRNVCPVKVSVNFWNIKRSKIGLAAFVRRKKVGRRLQQNERMNSSCKRREGGHKERNSRN